MIKVRKARAADILDIVRAQAALNRFHLRFGRRFYEPSRSAGREFGAEVGRQIRDPRSLVLVAENVGADGKVTFAGYLLAWIEQRPPIYRLTRVGYLSNIYVREGRRGAGVGKALFARFEDWLRQKKLDSVQVRAHVANRRALEAFRRWGFKDLAVTLSKEIKRP